MQPDTSTLPDIARPSKRSGPDKSARTPAIRTVRTEVTVEREQATLLVRGGAFGSFDRCPLCGQKIEPAAPLDQAFGTFSDQHPGRCNMAFGNIEKLALAFTGAVAVLLTGIAVTGIVALAALVSQLGAMQLVNVVK